MKFGRASRRWMSDVFLIQSCCEQKLSELGFNERHL